MNFEALEELLAQYLDDNTLGFVMTQVRQGPKKAKGRRWSDKDAMQLQLYSSGSRSTAVKQRQC